MVNHLFSPKRWGSVITGKRNVPCLKNMTLECQEFGSAIIHHTDISSFTFSKIYFADCIITGSTLIDCDLNNCVVEASNITSSTLTKCTISAGCMIKPSQMTYCKVYELTLIGCELFHSIIYDSKIQEGRLEECVVDTGKLTEIQAFLSQLRFCQINRGSATPHSMMINCKKEGSPKIRNALTQYSPLALRGFPVEVRGMILEYAIGGEFERANVIVAALRGEPELYIEALEIMNRTCVLRVASMLGPLLHRLCLDARASIQHLVIRTPVLPHFLSAHVARELHGIKTVEFDIGATETLDWSAYSHVMDSNRLALSFLEELFSSRASLTKICISFEKLHPMKDHPSFWSSIIISIKAAAKACTINLGASEPWTTPADDVKAITIVWKAEKGRVLSWSLGE